MTSMEFYALDKHCPNIISPLPVSSSTTFDIGSGVGGGSGGGSYSTGNLTVGTANNLLGADLHSNGANSTGYSSSASSTSSLATSPTSNNAGYSTIDNSAGSYGSIPSQSPNDNEK
ncbi:hypothetical protein QR98_0009340 [Sarcoptes scabiei]|uniref:Uncharacterized protein n=1 Tax=Sarcoptes scabiei TaxID=52283 RepID=A0A131ZVK2_SARSC|nr:hypothetical protein QR98_0009340 [Sarcoptes scabiei]